MSTPLYLWPHSMNKGLKKSTCFTLLFAVKGDDSLVPQFTCMVCCPYQLTMHIGTAGFK